MVAEASRVPKDWRRNTAVVVRRIPRSIFGIAFVGFMLLTSSGGYDTVQPHRENWSEPVPLTSVAQEEHLFLSSVHMVDESVGTA